MNSITGQTFVVERQHKGITKWVRIAEFAREQEYKDCLERIRKAYEGCSRKQNYRVLLRTDTIIETRTFPPQKA